MSKKSIILLFCSLFVLIFLTNCVKSCKFEPNYKEIGESALKNQKNLSETELRVVKTRCNF
jgi:hypothetical protein